MTEMLHTVYFLISMSVYSKFQIDIQTFIYSPAVSSLNPNLCNCCYHLPEDDCGLSSVLTLVLV